MKQRFSVWILAAFVGAVMVWAPQVVAQTGDTMARCDLVPLELPLFGGTPVAELSTPVVDLSASPADVSDEEIREVLEQFVACTNTGDPTLVWAMFSLRWFADTFADPEEHYLPAFESTLDGPAQFSSQPLVLVEVGEIVLLDDGRVDVTATFRTGNQEWTDTLTLVEIDGEWRIDEVRLDTGSE